MLFTKDQLKLIELLGQLAQENHIQIALVGGVVRDLFLGHSVEEKDFDFVVSGEIYTFAETVASKLGGELQRFEKFLTAKIINPKLIPSLAEIDLAHARKETYLSPGSLPEVVPAEIDQDLQRRDFTINAMAIPLSRLWDWLQTTHLDLEELYSYSKDPFQGRVDLAKKLVRVLHAQSFKDDPTRIFRALRYLARIDGKLEANTENLLYDALSSGFLNTISIQRVLNELRCVFAEKNYVEAFSLLCRYRVINAINLVPTSLIETLNLYVKKLGQLQQKNDSELRYQIFLRLCLSLLGEDERQAFIRRIALGRKTYKTYLNDLDFKTEATSEHSQLLRLIIDRK